MRTIIKIILFIPLSFLLCTFVLLLYDYLVEAMYLEAAICFVFSLLILILLRAIFSWHKPVKKEPMEFLDDEDYYDDEDAYNKYN